MNRKILFFALIIVNYGFAQNYAYIEKDSIAKLQYRLSDLQKLYNTDFYFPYDCGNKGVEMTKLSTSETTLMYELWTNEPLIITPLTQVSLPVFFTENVKNIEIKIIDKDGKIFSVLKKNNFEGYQTSIFETPLQNGNLTQTFEKMSHIYVYVTPSDIQKPSKLILSDLIVADYMKIKIISPLPLFKKMYAVNNSKGINKLNPVFKNSKSNTEWFSVEYCKSPILIETSKSSDGNNRLLYDILKACAADYPFYIEKEQDKKDIINKLDAIWIKDSLNSECNLAEKFQQLLRKSFHDGHFKVDLICKKDKKVLGPIRMTYISGKYQVSAVLDTLLEKDIPLGSAVSRVNNKNVQKVADSLKAVNYTDIYVKNREQLVLNDLSKDILSAEEGSKITYDFTTPTGELKSVNVTYQKKYQLKPNFTNVHCEFKEFDSNTAYFKVNSFDELPVIRFQSVVEKIKNKNLILDFRGNGGGDMVYLDDFLSFFIKDKTISMVAVTSRDEKRTDSLWIRNLNPHKMSISSQIIILFDAKTACASEIFINTLKKYNKNVTTIGADNTSGTLANAYNILLPTDKYTLTVNAPDMFKYTFGYLLEDVGISPDIKIKLNSVYDLKPYNDKVLQEAMQFMSKYTTSQKSKISRYHDK